MSGEICGVCLTIQALCEDPSLTLIGPVSLKVVTSVGSKILASDSREFLEVRLL